MNEKSNSSAQLPVISSTDDQSAAGVSRRHFLEAAGFSLSLAVVGCRRAPTETALPFVVQPEGVVPGRPQIFASTCGGCSAGCGLLASVRDGRPLKMEGMPEHPLSRGGLCAIGQALPLGLYDSHRLAHPLADGKEAKWANVDKAISERLANVKAEGTVYLVTSTVTSPTLQSTIDAFIESVGNARHITFDSISSSAIPAAHEQTHGRAVLPHYRFDKAKVILSIGADFLGTWISPVEFTAGWSQGRSPAAEMSYHVQMEGRMSLSGSNADRRYLLAPDEYAGVLGFLASELGKRAELTLPSGSPPAKLPLPHSDLDKLVDRLWAAKGESLVVCDSQDIVAQQLVNYINHALGNYGETLDIDRPSRQKQSKDADVVELIEALNAGQVAALFVAGNDWTHNLPDRKSLVNSIGEVPLVVSLNERVDDFGSLAHFICPDHHPLESWLDAEPVTGLVSITQPTIHPIGKTRSILESLNRWSGGKASMLELVQQTWKQIHPRAVRPQDEQPTFQEFWDRSVHDGFAETEVDDATPNEFQFGNVSIPEERESSDFTLVLYNKVGLTDSRHAHNPWLQELPDPVTKVTWDNYVCVSPATAKKKKLADGDIVKLNAKDGEPIELPVLVQRGQHDHVIAVALAYGVRGTDRFAGVGPAWIEARATVGDDELVGQNAAAFVNFHDGLMQFTQDDISLKKTSGHRELASTQRYHSLEIPRNVAPHGAEIRDAIVQETTLAAFVKDSHAGAPEHHFDTETQLWAEDHPKSGHRWGMVIDLNRCTGCSACLIACQSENNVPVVGKDEVRRQREMHWIRIDRYYGGDEDDTKVAHQPMMCQHCGNAPCETVCPVLATVHGEEGLNEQAYNRCVGTRYCANNCPYKVRRFNWFEYAHDDLLQNLALNPDVSVRGRGVMEKCSMCIQRIEDGKLEAKRRGEPLADGAVQTACQQSCPADAIIFGDQNFDEDDKKSRVQEAIEDPRSYGVLEEFNFRPSVSYQRVVRNREEETGGKERVEGGHHG